MTESVTFIYRDKDTGLGIAGADVKLRGSANNFATDLYTLDDQAGLPGSYAKDIDDMPFQKYKTWVNGAENKSFGGPSGRWLGNPYTVFGLKSVLTALSDTVTTLIATVATKAGLSSNNTFTGTNTFQQPIDADYPDYETDAIPSRFITNARLNLRLANLHGGVTYYAQVDVVPQQADNPGVQYSTIKKAVDGLIALYGNPTVNKIYRIIVRNNETNKSYITAAAGTIRDYVHIIGVDKTIMLNPADTNITADTWLENLSVLLAGAKGNRIFSSLNFLRVMVYGYNNYTHKGGSVDCSDFALPAIKTLTFDKTSGTDYVDVKRCLSKVDPVFTDGEAYSKARDCRYESGLVLIDDPTSDIDP